MILMNEIPDRFWSLFRSVNRSTSYRGPLKSMRSTSTAITFSREVCIQL